MNDLKISDKMVTQQTYQSIRDMHLPSIEQLSYTEMRCILPCLVRMGWCVPLDDCDEWTQKRKQIQKILSGIEVVNNIVNLLSFDFHALEMDVKKEQQLRIKLGNNANDSVLVSSLTDGLALEFERSDGIRKLRLLLSELISIMAYIRTTAGSSSHQNSALRASELFDNEVYLEDVSDVLCIAIAELPNTLQMLDVIEALLHVKNGTSLICRIVANFPESFHEVCLTLLNNGDKQDEDSFMGRMRIMALRLLCVMNPSEALVVRGEAVEMCRMPSLAIMLTLDYLRNKKQSNTDSPLTDIISFITGILLGNDDKVRTWFSQYIRNGQKKMDQSIHTSLADLRSELLKCLNLMIEKGLKNDSGMECGIAQSCVLLRLYCALRGVASMKFTEEETNSILKLIISHPPPSSIGIRFVSLGLCMILACPLLISNSENEAKAVEWIKWLVKEESYFGRLTDVRSSFGEMLLLIAIHFHGNQMNQIGELVSSTLGIKIPIRPNNLTRIKSIFTQDIFTDQVVTAHAVKVAVTPNLNNSVSGFLPVHCIYQLMKSRAFTKHKVSIKDWIFKQISNAIAPIHHIFPSLIEAYVNSIIVPNSKSALHTTNEPISEEEILKIFRHKVYSINDNENDSIDSPSCALTSQALLLYYVLLYQDIRLSHMKSILLTDRKVMKYSEEFIAQLPIFFIVQEVRSDQQNYGVLISSLLRLLAHHYPHLCLVKDWMPTKEIINTNILTEKFSFEKEADIFANAFNSNSSSTIISELDRLIAFPRNYLWQFAPLFISKLPLLLRPLTPRLVNEKSKKVWFRLNSIFPRKLWVMTVNALRPKLLPFGVKTQQLTWSDIVSDPLHVLRCDEQVFRNAELIEIVLHILNAFLAASRIHLSHHLLEMPSKSVEEEKDREELRVALLAAQESAAIQMLLECCLAREGIDSESGTLSNVREIQGLICSHLHQMFISDPNIVKLVHFQGYSGELLPLVVSAIPSMHICLDFIPELLGQPDLSKQAFAINLCSYLCQQYSITKSFSVAKLCFNVSMTLLSVLPSDKRAPFFINILPALVRMCHPFPPLCEDAIKLLIQLSQVNMSCLAATSPHFMFPEATLQLHSKVIDQIDWSQLNQYFSKLPNEDLLSVTLQKSFSTICSFASIRNIY